MQKSKAICKQQRTGQPVQSGTVITEFIVLFQAKIKANLLLQLFEILASVCIPAWVDTRR